MNQQLDTIIAQANLQIKKLQDALSESDRKYSDLENKNLDLRNAFKDKNKAFQGLQKQYAELKGEKMRFQARDAASEVAEQVSQGAITGRFPSRSHAVYSRGVGGVSGEFQGARGLYMRPHSGSSESIDGLRAQRAESLPMLATPSTHRTRLPMAVNQHQNSFGVDGITGVSRQPLNTLDPNNVGAPPLSGYGMSAGMKMGKTRSLNRTTPRVSRTSLPQEFMR
ncbi:cyclin b1 interacting protein 1 [Venturia nashicola]|nr:cyclin b1 interacting protein 1 [Venturia nashicola]